MTRSTRAPAALLALAVALLAGWQTRLIRTAVKSVRADARLPAFEARRSNGRARVLLVGDSTGTGAGSRRPELSLPGLIAAEFDDVDVVNRCRVSARLSETHGQLQAMDANGERFDLVLILAGGNDVLHATSMTQFANLADRVLRLAARLARRMVWMSCADVGSAPIFLPPISWWFSWRSHLATRVLAQSTRRADAAFIDFVRDADRERYAERPGLYFADDGVHPSAAAHRHCFELLMACPAMAVLGPARQAPTLDVDEEILAARAHGNAAHPPHFVPKILSPASPSPGMM